MFEVHFANLSKAAFCDFLIDAAHAFEVVVVKYDHFPGLNHVNIQLDRKTAFYGLLEGYERVFWNLVAMQTAVSDWRM
jgi:zinc transporter ZupT